MWPLSIVETFIFAEEWGGTEKESAKMLAYIHSRIALDGIVILVDSEVCALSLPSSLPPEHSTVSPTIITDIENELRKLYYY